MSHNAMVIPVTTLGAAQVYKIIVIHVEMSGAVRTLLTTLRDFAERRIRASARGIACGFGGKLELKHPRLESATFNHPDEISLAVKAARRLVAFPSVEYRLKLRMRAEDFAYVLEARHGGVAINPYKLFNSCGSPRARGTSFATSAM